MATMVADASVVTKWYVPERDHKRALALRDDYLNGRHDLVAPALLPFEVINALKFSGHYEGDRLIEAATTLPEYGIELIPYRDVGPVAELAVELDITLYDASYLALAHSNEATLYTADSRLLETIESGACADRSAHIRAYGG
ncbi:MAG: type II toxin-antitoxin system VapC family toxin [Salinirussus sp.]